MPLNDPDLHRMRAIVEAATPGPWSRDGYGGVIIGRAADFDNEADAAFIASARADWPRCLDEIERLRTALFELAEEMVGNLHPNHRRDELEMGWTGRLLALVHPDGVAQWQAWREKAGRG